jgi:radical SAM protein with 4Fe4S-binding SPASM domain
VKVMLSGTMDVFDYADQFFFRSWEKRGLDAPVQIELHLGIHCDLYRCPHCYGHGQHICSGQLISADEIAAILDEVADTKPVIVVSGVATEPLTHPSAAEIVSLIASKGFPLGLYTKGRRLDVFVRRALIAANAETWVTVSLDAISSSAYMRKHGVHPAARDGIDGTFGANYFETVLDNLSKLRAERDLARSRLHIRAAFLLFMDDAVEENIHRTIEAIGPHVDLLKFAFPQKRNDGRLPGLLPEQRGEVLKKLGDIFSANANVKILITSESPVRSTSFSTCHTQRFQTVIDSVGNLFPCPQVALQPYRHLAYGNIRMSPLKELLRSPERVRMFGLDVDKDMRCRICDRKDEALNIALEARLRKA